MTASPRLAAARALASLLGSLVALALGLVQACGGEGAPVPIPAAMCTGEPLNVCQMDSPDQTCFPFNPDANCNTANSSSDAECTTDCRVPCGFNGVGLKHCRCVDGRYESCPCPRPPPSVFGGALSAGFCDGLTAKGSGMTRELDEQPCTSLWQECIARDPVQGDTPRGCVCMLNDQGALEWTCGSTNNWFSLETEAGGVCQGSIENVEPGCAGVNCDPNCNSSFAETGATCTQSCYVSCGFQRLGMKTCTCTSGTYSQCPCPRPEGYLGAPTAPRCTLGDGNTAALVGLPCMTEWEQCIGSDVVTGNTPRGCACLKNPLNGELRWYCGSTNRWFRPE